MFYSHEVLTSRKYGVATVWLVATLGPKSGTKKVNRKAILEVNVRKACETIIQPEAPMALRLQSNLLYGVSRVYDQQCGYVLQDVQSAQNNMRALLKVIRTNDLDSDAGKARPDQLILMDDPAFIPELPLPRLEFDLSSLDNNLIESQHSYVSSILSSEPRPGGSSKSSHRSVAGLVIPSSEGDSYHGLPPMNDPFFLAVSSAQKTPSAMGGQPYDENNEEAFFDDDLGFEFDAEGGLVDVDPAKIEHHRTGSTVPQPHGRLGSDSVASARARREHEEAAAILEQAQLSVRADDEDINRVNEDEAEDIYQLSDAQLFVMASSPPGQSRQTASMNREDSEAAFVESSSMSAEAPLVRRKRRGPKPLTIDDDIELPGAVVKGWQQNYLENMNAATRTKDISRASAQARRVAERMVWGDGIGGIGALIRESGGMNHALGMFAGEGLRELITGIPLMPSTPIAAARSAKRPLETEGGEEDERRVRSRQEGENMREEDVQLGRALDDEPQFPGFDDSTVLDEVAREAAPELPELPSSAMPWNVSNSIRSYRASVGGTAGGPRSSSVFIPGSLPYAGGRFRTGSRLTSASPLMGRGPLPNLPGDIEDMEGLGPGHAGPGVDLPQLPPPDEDEDDNSDDGRERVDMRMLSDLLVRGFRFHERDEEEDELYRREVERDEEIDARRASAERERERQRLERELHGPLAAIDTQTAQQSQTVREALAREAMNFFDFVKNSIQERRLNEEEEEDDVKEAEDQSVSFEELIPPAEQSFIVAAQAFHHVLTLATKGLLRVQQVVDYGNISLWVRRNSMLAEKMDEEVASDMEI